VRFPTGLPREYYDGLVSEVFDPEKSRFVKRRGRRNEALDTWVYAYAAAHHPELRVHRKTIAEWDQLAARLEPDGPTAKPAGGELLAAPVTAPTPQPKPAQKPKPAKSGYAKSDWGKRW